MRALFDSLKLAWQRASDTNTGLLAAGIAYYAFLSFMPLLAALVLTYGLAVDPETLAEHTGTIATTLPPSASELVSEQLESVATARKDVSGFGLALAIALSLFGARVAAGAVINAFNIAFEAPESRGWVRSNLLALCITIGSVVAIALVAATTAFVSVVLRGQGGALAIYAVVGLAGFGGALFAYRIVPNTNHSPLSACLWGAVLFAAGWMIASAGFSYYAANIASYNATYGSLGAIVVLLTWLFLSAYLLLLGAHLTTVKAGSVAD